MQEMMNRKMKSDGGGRGVPSHADQELADLDQGWTILSAASKECHDVCAVSLLKLAIAPVPTQTG
jgi:hypothetical protein